ncbi:hypothetical protein HZU77_012285 [Neisseriaceae bacterium TC5R-5]|nr:hypothetical protein [Neisseriaceae bacterium TC5R-5]
MAKDWFTGVVETYCQVMERGQRRLLDAQQEACLSWVTMMLPNNKPWSEGEAQRRVEGSLLMGASLVQAQADTQRDFMLLMEKLFNEAGRSMQHQLAEAGDHPSVEAMSQACEIACLSGSAMSKLSRQVGHFAATSLSSTPLRAACDVGRVWKQQKP